MQSRTLRIFKEVTPVLAAALIGVLLIGGFFTNSASAQYFPFFGGGGAPQRQQQQRGGGGFGGGFFGGDDGPFFQPFQQRPRRAPVVREDFSRAPPAEKRDAPAERNVLVLGDSMADWLAYGLEDAYSEQSDIGILRRHKTGSGLIRYQAKGEPGDWVTAAKAILAQDKPDAIVVMLGLNDRMPLREPAAKPGSDKADKKDARKLDDAGKKPDDKTDAELSDDPADIADPTPIVTPEKTARAPSGSFDFRDERWVELYAKKIDELAAVLKARGVPVVWVGLPAIRGTKATADMLFLDNLYREASGRDGFTYVDVWDGFVDEAGRYVQQGPDFEGQIRRLRSPDGVFFSRAGARKLAHYAEREISRLLASRTAPAELPAEPAQPEADAKSDIKPGAPPPRPLAGPIMPLVAAAVNSDQLMGASGSRPAPGDTLAARTLVRGEPLSAPAGRADDAVWPRREVGREQAPKGGDMPMASAAPGDGAQTMAAPQPPKPRKPRPIRQAQQPPSAGFDVFGSDPASRGRQQRGAQSGGMFDFFR